MAKHFRAVLLAAGEGSRLGRIPKSLFRLNGETLLERQLNALIAAGASHIVVVTGYFHSMIEDELDQFRKSEGTFIEIVRHAQPELGQQTSVLLGLRALSLEHHSCEPVLIVLADQPLMQESDYNECLNAFNNRPGGCSIVYPVFEGRRGNPVTLCATVVTPIIESGMSCREYIHTHPEQVHRFSTLCDHYVFDIDEQQDLDRFAHRFGMPLTPPDPTPDCKH